ncbi:ankyrin repeat domain-containing protein [Bacteroidota bacterium]
MNLKTYKIFLLSICLIIISCAVLAQEDIKNKENAVQDTLSDKQIKEREFLMIQLAEKGKSDSVLALLNQGVNVNARTWNNYSALIFAAQNGHLKTVQILLLNGADPNLQSDNKESALISSIKYDHEEIAELLIQNDAEINIRDNNEATALMYASAFDNFELADMLLYYGADPDLCGKNKETALFTATSEGNFSIVNLLIEYGANPEIADDKKNTPAFIAALNADIEILGLLIEYEANINSANIKGYTPLDAAIMNNDSLMVSVLLEKGSDPLHKIGKNINTLTLASQYSHGKDISNMLKAAGVKRLKTAYIGYIPLSYINSFNYNDFMMGLNLGLFESRYNFALNLGYLFNPGLKTILLDRGNSVFYQVRERRHMIFAGFEKHIPIMKSYSGYETGLIIGIKEYFSFGKYQGLTEKPEKTFIFSPVSGIYLKRGRFGSFIKYEYLDLQKNKISPHRICLGLSYLIPAN